MGLLPGPAFKHLPGEIITQESSRALMKESKCEKDMVATELKCNYVKRSNIDIDLASWTFLYPK